MIQVITVTAEPPSPHRLTEWQAESALIDTQWDRIPALRWCQLEAERVRRRYPDAYVAWWNGLVAVCAPSARQTSIGAGKLERRDVEDIRRRLQAGESQTAVAASYEIHPSMVSQIWTGKVWRVGK